MNYIKVRAHGKINIGLDIVRKRDDGYHEVKMIMQTVGMYDNVKIEREKSVNERSIEIETNLAYVPSNETNLAYKAADLLMSEFSLTGKIKICIHKMIPVSAGMAGGSADCAAVMRGINTMYGLKLSEKDLMQRGVKLGADVPYCIMQGTALSEGIGEILTPIKPMMFCYIVLVKPYINISTRFVYDNLRVDEIDKHPDIDGMIRAIEKKDLTGLASKMGNVLEMVTAQKYPIVDEIKGELKKFGALNAIMSGSGSTVFGIFDNEAMAQQAYTFMKNRPYNRQVYITEPYNRQRIYKI